MGVEAAPPLEATWHSVASSASGGAGAAAAAVAPAAAAREWPRPAAAEAAAPPSPQPVLQQQQQQPPAPPPQPQPAAPQPQPAAAQPQLVVIQPAPRAGPSPPQTGPPSPAPRSPAPRSPAGGGGCESPPPLSPGGGGDDDFAAVLSELQCPICLDPYGDPVTLPCGHTICKVHVAELAALVNHPDSGVTELDCPKCRERAHFASGDDIKVNLEMKNAVELLLRAARKSAKQRRSEREARLARELAKREEDLARVRQQQLMLDQERRRVRDEQQRLEEEKQQDQGRLRELEQVRQRSREAQAASDNVARERERLERERRVLQQQRDEVNRRAHEVLRQESRLRAAQADGEPQEADLHQREQEVLRLRREAEERKERERRERDDRIQAECQQWMLRAQKTQRLATEARADIGDAIRDYEHRIRRYEAACGSGDDSDSPAAPRGGFFARARQLPVGDQQQPAAGAAAAAPAPFAPPAAHPGSPQQGAAAAAPWPQFPRAAAGAAPQAAAAAGPVIRRSSLSQLDSYREGRLRTPADPAPAPQQQRRSRWSLGAAPELQPVVPAPAPAAAFEGARGVNPITGVPDPAQLCDDAPSPRGFSQAELENMYGRQQAALPRKDPEDYYNYQFGDDGVDHELHRLLNRQDARWQGDIEEARKRRELALKAEIAEKRAREAIARHKNGGAAPRQPARPSYRPKLGRRVPV